MDRKKLLELNNGLSRRRAVPGEPVETDDPEEWLDQHLGLWVAAFLGRGARTLPPVAATGRLILYPEVESKRVSSYFKCPAEGVFATTMATRDNREVLVDPKQVVIVPPRNERLQAKDRELTKIRDFLSNLTAPDVDDKQLLAFAQKAKRYFMFDGRLMRRDDLHKHKVVILDQRQCSATTGLRVRTSSRTHVSADEEGVRAAPAELRST